MRTSLNDHADLAERLERLNPAAPPYTPFQGTFKHVLCHSV